MKNFQYSCGCSFEVLEEDNLKISFDPIHNPINLECSKTWELISDGNTKGCFQLESRLGKSMAKKLKPENIEQLSALISILRPGCISGDTKIHIKEYTHSVDNRQRFAKAKIRDMAQNPARFPSILSYNEQTGCFVNNKMLNVFYTGDKECFKIIIRSNERKSSEYGSREYKLECTDDHKLLTPHGWKCLKDINIGDRILVTKRKGTKIPGLGKKMFRQRCYNTYQTKCIFCDWNKGSLDVNHINGNRNTNNDPDNLCYLCPNHHREFTEGNISKEKVIEYKNKHRLPSTIDGKWCTLANKISVGIKDVYDISMNAPHHNFIAGGVIVHNCLEAFRDGKSVSNHYIDKKNGEESVDYYHPSLEASLSTTYGEMIYQEQAMEIAKQIAGFNLQEADSLRKAIGKKKPEEMAKLKKKFISGAKKLDIVNKEQANEIFGWIEKSQRYSFNKSHAVSYAMNAYLSAYAKAHFPKIFFASYLRFAKDKIDPKAEIKALVQNANEMDINICVPDIRNLNEFFIMKNKKIYFGLTDIKGFGKSVYNKLIKLIQDNNIDIDNVEWLDLLFKILNNMNSTASKAVIRGGGLDFIKKTRTAMLFEYSLISDLTKKECEFIINNMSCCGNLYECLYKLLHEHKLTTRRKPIISGLIDSLSNPPYSLEDSPEWISDSEDEILGCSMTCSKVDMYDISMTNCNCKDFKNTRANDIIICGEIASISVTKTKSGKNPGSEMAFISLSDSYGLIDSVIFFPEAYKQYRNILFDNNIIIIKGKKSKSGDSFIVEKAFIPRT
jgi:DNA polymerase III alpha subunit